MQKKEKIVATKKAPAIDKLITAVTGKDRTETIINKECMLCENKNLRFANELSRREYAISGMCQECQDKAFGTEKMQESRNMFKMALAVIEDKYMEMEDKHKDSWRSESYKSLYNKVSVKHAKLVSTSITQGMSSESVKAVRMKSALALATQTAVLLAWLIKEDK